MRGREPAAERLLAVGVEPAGVDPAQREETRRRAPLAVADGDHVARPAAS
jgi:hypothetical protein